MANPEWTDPLDFLDPSEAVAHGECRFCGRDYRGEIESGPCPSDDDCPSHFEAVGREHPDHRIAA